MSNSASTIVQLLSAGVPHAIALSTPGGSPLNYRALRELATQTVAALNAKGIGNNDRVAIVLENGPEMAAAFLCVAAGATAAPLNPAYRADEFEFYLSDLKAKVLLIERDKDVRLLLRDILEPHGYRVIEAADPAKAMALVTNRAEPIHLILATLGEDGGFAVFDQLRGARPDAKILCVSARPAAAEQRGAADPAMLQKPFTVLHLLGKVRQVLDGRDG
jgi:acyl-CoA synthetase (AMP-forming)/AMP-acid ligase II